MWRSGKRREAQDGHACWLVCAGHKFAVASQRRCEPKLPEIQARQDGGPSRRRRRELERRRSVNLENGESAAAASDRRSAFRAGWRDAQGQPQPAQLAPVRQRHGCLGCVSVGAVVLWDMNHSHATFSRGWFPAALGRLGFVGGVALARARSSRANES